MNNLALKIMMGHSKGNIVHVVKSQLSKVSTVLLKFDGKCGDRC